MRSGWLSHASIVAHGESHGREDARKWHPAASQRIFLRSDFLGSVVLFPRGDHGCDHLSTLR